MTTDRRLLGAALGFALLVAACGGSSSTSPAATATANGGTQATAGAATDAPTEAAPTEAAPTEAAATDATSGGDNGAAATDLEALIPDKLGSTTMQKSSFDYSKLGLAGLPLDSTELDPYLKEKGKSAADLSMAVGIGSTGSPMVYIIRIKGVPASDFGPKVMSIDTTDMDQKTIAGKQVYSSGTAGMSTIIYNSDDKLVYILLASDQQAEQILQGMP